MKYAHRLICLATLTLALIGTGGAKADLIQPTDARGIRQFPGHDPFLLNFLSIQHAAEDQTGVEHLDVTAAVLAAQAAGDHFLGFRLSTTTDTRWLLGQIAGLANPTLNAEVVPEPSALVLWGIGGLGLLGYWRRRKIRGRDPRMLFRPRVEGLEDRCLLSTVTNLTDHDPGSLRDAIATTPPGGTVDFEPGLSGTIVLTTGELAIAKDLTIAGPGAGVITVNANFASRVFNIQATFTVAISGLTIANGSVTSARGGGIYNAGRLTVTDSTLSGNSAIVSGGGILNNDTLTVTNSTLSGNSATLEGGGIFNGGPSMVTVINSTLSGNSATVGGGIYNAGGTLTVTDSTLSGNSAIVSGGGILNNDTLTVTNSTLSGNSAGSGGGGILNNNTLTVTNSTFSGNSASVGGGIYNFLATLTVTSSTLSGNSASGAAGGGGIYNGTSAVTNSRNTILAGNSASYGPDMSGFLHSQGHNLIGDGSGASGFNDTDLVGTPDLPIDPQLEPLGDYGGPTQAMRPLPSSPAVDAGDNTDAPDTDQRGFDRIVNGIIDIGSVELQPDEFGPRSPASLLIAFEKLVSGSWGSVGAPVRPLACQEVTELLQYVDTPVRRAKDLVFGESHRAQRPVPASEWESNELVARLYASSTFTW
jgi:hypothetical protein